MGQYSFNHSDSEGLPQRRDSTRSPPSVSRSKSLRSEVIWDLALHPEGATVEAAVRAAQGWGGEDEDGPICRVQFGQATGKPGVSPTSVFEQLLASAIGERYQNSPAVFRVGCADDALGQLEVVEGSGHAGGAGRARGLPAR